MIRGALAVAAVLVATIAPAAAEPTPAEALARVEAAYAKLQRLSTRVVEVQTSGAYGTQTTLKGRVHVARPDRVRADYDMPPLPGKQRGPATLASSHVIAGDVSWIVDHRARELREQAASTSLLPIALRFATGGLAKTHELGAPATRDLVPGMVVLELAPKPASPAYTRLRLIVDPGTWRVERSIVVTRGGDTVSYEWLMQQRDPQLEPSLFVVDPARYPSYKRAAP